MAAPVSSLSPKTYSPTKLPEERTVLTSELGRLKWLGNRPKLPFQRPFNGELVEQS